MEAERITLPNGNTASLAATHTLTAANDSTIKVVPVPSKKVVVFFIGGAGDKKRFLFDGPNYNVVDVKRVLENTLQPRLLARFPRYTASYLGYYEAFGEKNISSLILPSIPSKSTPIYIIGHSLGGWNGAHLSNYLSSHGYTVRLLVTLDPVGESSILEFSSKIYGTTPIPKAEQWINIRAQAKNGNASDFVASLGERWIISSGPTINITLDINHADAASMFISPIAEGKSARDIIMDAIVQDLQQ